jgi:PhnB protein
MKGEQAVIHTTIAPWLTIQNASKAVEFYKAAFAAIETYRLETPEGLVVKLSVNGAEFWLSGGHMAAEHSDIHSLACANIRMILSVSNPDILFANALAAGASEIFPITEEHGWRLGRLVDPFGLHWEIGHPVSK